VNKYGRVKGPGKAIKQSELQAISAFLWCMLATGFTSPTVLPVNCMSHQPTGVFKDHAYANLCTRTLQKEEEKTMRTSKRYCTHRFAHQSSGDDPAGTTRKTETPNKLRDAYN